MAARHLVGATLINLAHAVRGRVAVLLRLPNFELRVSRFGVQGLAEGASFAA